MKKVLFVFLLFCLGILVIYEGFGKKVVNTPDEKNENVTSFFGETKGVFISYIDYGVLKGKDETSQKKIIDEMIDNSYSYGLNSIILQVRPFSDAIYYSKIFKPSLTVVNSEEDRLNFDILSYFIEKAHLKNMKLYAWVNPYRIRNNSDVSSISDTSVFYSWLDTNDIYVSENGIYFNPSSKRVLNLIIRGIKEIVSNYDVDGVLYDDYFYPNKVLDNEDYDKYVEDGGDLSIDEYRVENINNLILNSYNAVKGIKKDVLFGISPAGNIENNLENEYLDVKYLLKNNGYLDFVIPQLYYGFDNHNKPYIDTVKVWNNLIETTCKLYVGLGIYKSGTEDKYALSGKDEWIENTDIIKKQVVIARNESNYDGFFVFRYAYLFNDMNNDNLSKEVLNLKTLLNS